MLLRQLLRILQRIQAHAPPLFWSEKLPLTVVDLSTSASFRTAAILIKPALIKA